MTPSVLSYKLTTKRGHTMFSKASHRKFIPYKIVLGITSSMFGIATIITWLLYSISEVDFNFFLEHYGIYSILILTASLLSLTFLAFIPLNKIIKIVEEYELNQGIESQNSEG